MLSTTRAVRKRLDFERPVPESVLRECVELAVQAAWSFRPADRGDIEKVLSWNRWSR